MSDYLFAYGTLQPGHVPEEIAHAAAELRPVGKGSMRGVLYDLGEYPGAVSDASPAKRVFGTVFRLSDDQKLLRDLDDYEGFDPDAPEKSLFVRSLYPVRLASGRTIRCWVYFWNQKSGGARVLPSGRYRRATAARRIPRPAAARAKARGVTAGR
jgi:gamma-glutamylcyclotransferase (GGCT)/AIG2-like uncharacterized protein YtfP